jgi:L-ribulose-5-phosphate 3-epimerase
MNTRLNRRNFLTSSAVAGAGLLLASRLDAAPWKTTLHKAMQGVPNEQLLKSWKAAGFDGIESTAWQVSLQDAVAARKTAESLGMRIHSVQFGWGDFNGSDAATAKTVADIETALRVAEGYGADDVLCVPGRIDGMPMPEAWEFDIRFDERTGHLRQVVAGDNAKYQKYIEVHNHAFDASREGIRKLIPTAEKTKVIIAVENAWSNLCVKPDIFKNFVDSFDSPWVKVNFDIGNHVKYLTPPQDWIRTLGKLVIKCHVKDFKLKPDKHGGEFCNIRDGSVDWPAVRQALDDIDYRGWMTIESGDLSPQEHGRRLDLILEGK